MPIMRPQQPLLKLPASLANEIGVQSTTPRGRQTHGGPAQRKERRKAERSQKKEARGGPPPSKRRKANDEAVHGPIARDFVPKITEQKPLKRKAKASDQDSQATKRKSTPTRISRQALSPSPPPSKTVPRAVQKKLAQDDEEIAELERRLGLKGKKKTPKSLAADGLDDLLTGLEGTDNGDRSEVARKSDEAAEWLETKRRKARGLAPGKEDSSNSEHDDESVSEDDSSYNSVEREHLDTEKSGSEDFDGEENSDSSGDFDAFASDDEVAKRQPTKRVRENPYVAPITATSEPTGKYVPPSRRQATASESEQLVRLRRQTQGLVNRLTESNMLSILGEIEKLYRENARHDVTVTLVNLLLTSVCEPTSLPDTLIILPAGFIAALYKVIGTDFGAQLIQRTVELFDEHHERAKKSTLAGTASNASKETSNLITLLSELYNFQVIGSNLIFDYIRLFLATISELNTELLLRVIRCSGPQLRQDDPSALRDIVALLRPAVAAAGEQHAISVRTKFMVETINDLKNNKLKAGAAASAVVSEHTVRMRKTLGSLNNARTLKASEPLRFGLRDVRDADSRGKWWLVGASWAGHGDDEAASGRAWHGAGPGTTLSSRGGLGGGAAAAAAAASAASEEAEADLAQLAREQRMNTDVRRAIFVSLVSAADCEDARLRLLKLRLRRAQELEIPRVLVHCCGAEQRGGRGSYNPYYALVARRLCAADRRLRTAFQFALWDLLRGMGEGADADDDDDNNSDDGGRADGAGGDGDGEDDGDGGSSTRRLFNLAKMFGVLVADEALPLAVLRKLSLGSLRARTRTFVEVMLITVLLHLGRHSDKDDGGDGDGDGDDDVDDDDDDGGRKKKKRQRRQQRRQQITAIFAKTAEAPQLARGLLYFLKKVVARTDIAGGKAEMATVRWGCGVAVEALQGIVAGADG